MTIGGQSDTSAKLEKQVYRLTPEGYAKKREQLDYLRTVKRKEIADYIHDAKEAGDISESSAYEDAKNEQAKLEGQILELERLLAVAEIMTSDMHNDVEGPAVVRIGMQVDVTSDFRRIPHLQNRHDLRGRSESWPDLRSITRRQSADGA